MVESDPSFRAKASIEYDSGNNLPMIVCETPVCEFHQAGSCLNSDVAINDDCPLDQFCESFKQIEANSHNKHD